MDEAENKRLKDVLAPARLDEDLTAPNPFASHAVSSFDDDEPLVSDSHHSFTIPVDHAGSSVFVQAWATIHSNYPPVLFIPDLGETSDFYAPAARELAQKGFNVYAYDMRGHGRSSGIENMALGLSDLIQDLLQVVAWIRYKSDRRKPFLVAQGMGALIALNFQKHYPQYSTPSVLVAPTCEEHSTLPFVSRFFLKTIAQLVPWLNLPSTLLPYFLPMSDEASHRASSVALSARFAEDLRDSVRNAAKTFSEVAISNLIINPLDDGDYNSPHLNALVKHHPFFDQISYREVRGIGASALCAEPDEIQAVMQELTPWMLDICSGQGPI